VAPFAVFFDSVGTAAASTTRPFHELSYCWNFGDRGSGAFATTGRTKNEAWSPVAGHVFETAGTYVVTLYVRDDQNREAVRQVSVTVQSPDEAYPETDTRCFANGPDNTTNFAGCPAGATHVPNVTSFSALQSHVASGRRLLLRRGDTFTAGGGLDLTGTGGTVGAYGSGNRPVITADGSTLISPASDWRVMDLDAQGSGTGTFASLGVNISHFVMLRVRAVGMATGLIGGSGRPRNEHPDVPVLADCELRGSGNPPATVYLLSRRTLFLGNIFRNASVQNGQHVFRAPSMDRGVVSDNDFADAQSAGHLLKLHAPHADSGPWTASVGYSERVVISNNIFRGTGQNVWMVGVAPQNPNYDERLRDILIERNFFTADVNDVRNALNVWSVEDGTVRNNIFTGASTNFSVAMNVGCESEGDCNGQVPSERIDVVGNTCHHPSRSLTCVVVAGGNNVRIRNNLGAGAVMMHSGDTAALSNNLVTTQPQFVSPAPTVPAQFRITATSPAVDAGLPHPGLTCDFIGVARDALPDVGAFEYAVERSAMR
jgi:hypothetical protein